MGYETLLITREANVATLTINRPAVLNALSAQVFQEMMHFLDDKTATQGLRALIITGAGEKAFIAGADIAAMQSLTPVQALKFARLGQDFTVKLEEQPFISIARVQGYALGGGCEVAMACDFVVASETALFGQPEVDLGLIPGFGGTQRLARRVGLPMAMEMLCAGRKLNGKEAVQHGLASTVVPAAELDAAIAKIIKNILKAAPHAIAETKRLARASLEQPLSSGLSAEATAFATCFAGEESREGIQAFLEKRKAQF
ncbi:MAG: enoyl-CoA hydratase/isomerase family protein [Chitinophagaceae bacterium]|nr:enoyl-CoA hydratase/isomerase family protein [Oligoflexus sp.]